MEEIKTMSKFDYETYIKQQEQSKSFGDRDSQDGVKAEYLSRYLKNDGDYVIVRFPYSSTSDFELAHVHNVKFPESAYDQHVECLRDGNDPIEKCPLCQEGTPVVNRFLIKVLAYVHSVGANGASEIKIIPAVWDRPFGYAKELAGKLNEYGDLREHLFKIKRSGTGKATTYSTDIVLNKSVYNPEVYKADFELLENVSPIRMLVKSIDKWTALKENDNADDQPAQETNSETLRGTAPVHGAYTPQVMPAEHPRSQTAEPQTAPTKRTYSFN